MRIVDHWISGKTMHLAESKSGVRVTRSPIENVVLHDDRLLPPPELLQKFYKSVHFIGRTPEDEQLAREGLGYYCDIQSLNSEDAVTWSFFGTIAYMSMPDRNTIGRALFKRLGLPDTGDKILVWLWRRLPHPEKTESIGGPEIDFGLMSAESLVLGEAKWNSPVGMGQGLNKDRSQLDLRLAYCEKLAPHALPSVRHRIILGVGRKADVLTETSQSNYAEVRNISWKELVSLFPRRLASELELYLEWREKNATDVGMG
jgi:hypothetical protein